MSEQNPLISVIVPVFNGAGFLPDAIASIRAQSYGPVEIIVVDDGSTDETAAVAKAFGDDLRYQFQDNRGPGGARNAGIALASAEIIAFLDVDDLWPADKLAWQLRELQRDASLDYVAGFVQVHHWSGEENGRAIFRPVEEPKDMFLLGAVLFRRSAFDHVGLFDESMPGGEDTDWYFRARQAGICNLVSPELALDYRLHKDNLTKGMNKSMSYFLRAMQKSAARNKRLDQNNL